MELPLHNARPISIQTAVWALSCSLEVHNSRCVETIALIAVDDAVRCGPAARASTSVPARTAGAAPQNAACPAMYTRTRRRAWSARALRRTPSSLLTHRADSGGVLLVRTGDAAVPPAWGNAKIRCARTDREGNRCGRWTLRCTRQLCEGPAAEDWSWTWGRLSRMCGGSALISRGGMLILNGTRRTYDGAKR